jgi:hypothetical protein
MLHTTHINVDMSTNNIDKADRLYSLFIEQPIILTKEIEFTPGQNMLDTCFVIDLSPENHLMVKSVCIIAEKVLASCQQRECIPVFKAAFDVGIPPFTFIDITFRNGVIVQPIKITPIPSRPNFSRLQFAILIPYILTIKDSVGQIFTQAGYLPDINEDIVMYFPATKPEYTINLRVETRTEMIASPVNKSTTVQLSIGSLIIINVTGLVHMFIPSFGYCPEPRQCENFKNHVTLALPH